MNEKFDKFFIAKFLRYSLIHPIRVRDTFFSGLPRGTELENFEEHAKRYCKILQITAKYYKILQNTATYRKNTTKFQEIMQNKYFFEIRCF
jgi:hypothetical protein